MAKRSPVLGYNHNVKYRGVIFHVQTEDSGVVNPHVFTHLFHGGVIVSTRKYVYDPGADDGVVKALMQSQHKAVMKELKHGKFDDKIDEYLGTLPELLPRGMGDAEAAAAGAAAAAAVAVAALDEERSAAGSGSMAVPSPEDDEPVSEPEIQVLPASDSVPGHALPDDTIPVHALPEHVLAEHQARYGQGRGRPGDSVPPLPPPPDSRTPTQPRVAPTAKGATLPPIPPRAGSSTTNPGLRAKAPTGPAAGRGDDRSEVSGAFDAITAPPLDDVAEVSSPAPPSAATPLGMRPPPPGTEPPPGAAGRPGEYAQHRRREPTAVEQAAAGPTRRPSGAFPIVPGPDPTRTGSPSAPPHLAGAAITNPAQSRPVAMPPARPGTVPPTPPGPRQPPGAIAPPTPPRTAPPAARPLPSAPAAPVAARGPSTPPQPPAAPVAARPATTPPPPSRPATPSSRPADQSGGTRARRSTMPRVAVPAATPGRPSGGVVMSRPAVIVGGPRATPPTAPPAHAAPPRAATPPPTPPPMPPGSQASSSRVRKAREEPAGRPGFGADLISERSLDEVILAYLSEDAEE